VFEFPRQGDTESISHEHFHAVASVVDVLFRAFSDEWPAPRFRRPFFLGRLAPILDFLGEPVAS
jgi:hypothetical protein